MNNIIYRKGKPKHFQYISKNKKILDKKFISNIEKYRIPPAWKNVEITLNKDLIAVGFDEAGRKQYVYSQNHIEKKRILKYCNLIDFIKVIPKIRKDIEKRLKSPTMSKDKLIAILLNIIIICSFRIGTEGHRIKYNSQGISTVTKKELKIGNKNIIIDFIGKKQVRNTCKITDVRLVKLLKDLYKRSNRNDNIFQYGGVKVNIIDVNNYLKSFNEKITSKVFRTWLANTKFIDKIIPYTKNTSLDSENKRVKLVREIKKEIASEMHHTVAICSKSYLIKELIDIFIEKPEIFKKRITNNFKPNNGVLKAENALLYYLKIYCK